MSIGVSVDDFGYLNNTNATDIIRRFTVHNGKLFIQLINYGATISSIQVPSINKKTDEIVLGFDDIISYANDKHYFGSTIGRFANRIAKGQFFLHDKRYQLAINNGPNHLHGGIRGFNKVIWDYSVDANKVSFFYTSPSMEENYPGELKCSVSYELTDSNEVIIRYHAIAMEKTPINMTNHSYFNLGGHDFKTVCDHVISINADYYTPIDEDSIPTGEILPVAGTPFDLREPQTISCILTKIPGGVDHNFCVNGVENEEKKVARIEHPKSGRVMEIFSTQPGVQFYTANFLPEDNSLIGKDGKCYIKHGAFCLETQNYPDAINHMNFPKAYLDTGEEYKHTTRLCFSVK